MSDRTPEAAPPGQIDAAATGGGQQPRSRGLLRAAMLAGVVTALLAAVVVSSAYLIVRHDRSSAPGQLLRPSGIPASISTSLATLMALTPVPATQAPGFTLTDQRGRTLSLAAFHGKVVVLEFMDPHCTDICPIVSNEFIDAYHDLGPLAGKVVFAAVNVNQYHAAVRDMAQYSSEHQLTTIPDWHFLTGPVPQLQTVWRDYNVEVQAPNPNADIVHTSAVYFIDTQGREKYLASPMTAVLSAGVLVAAYGFGSAAWTGWAQLALTLPVYAWAGALFHRGALQAARHRTTNMDTLVSLGTTVAFGYSAIATIALPFVQVIWRARRPSCSWFG